jgi:hypothetical protein
MQQERIQNREGALSEAAAFAERIKSIQQRIQVRDDRQNELLGLIAQPDKKGKVLTDAWLELELAQEDLKALLRHEIDQRLSAV